MIKEYLVRRLLGNDISFDTSRDMILSFRDEQDILSKEYFKKLNQRKKDIASISAVYRVKNGSSYIELSILSIAPIVSEIIVVDNGSTDNTLEIVERLALALEGICEIKVFSYDIQPSFAGEGYIDAVRLRPETSLAKYYSYCFGKASGSYLMKCDAHYVFTPRGIKKIQDKIKKHPRILRYRGSEIFGRALSLEPFIFLNDSNYSFVDGEHFELLEFKQKLNKSEFLNSTIISPCFIHLKRLAYSKLVSSSDVGKVVEGIYK